MIYTLLVLFVMFIYWGYLNFNDPDAPLWVTIYFAAAAICMMAFFGITYWFVDAPVIIFYIAYSIKNWPNKWMGFKMPMNDHDMNIEKGRESVGLLIAAACVIFSYFVSRGWSF